jgi:hypothetical protein
MMMFIETKVMKARIYCISDTGRMMTFTMRLRARGIAASTTASATSSAPTTFVSLSNFSLTSWAQQLEAINGIIYNEYVSLTAPSLQYNESVLSALQSLLEGSNQLHENVMLMLANSNLNATDSTAVGKYMFADQGEMIAIDMLYTTFAAKQLQYREAFMKGMEALLGVPADTVEITDFQPTLVNGPNATTKVWRADFRPISLLTLLSDCL